MRGLLRGLGLVALVAVTGGLLQDPPWPSPDSYRLAVALYVGAPLVVAVAAGVLAWRVARVRLPAAVVAATATVALVASVVLVVWVGRLNDELTELLGPSCGPTLDDCRELAAATFDGPPPRLPTVPAVEGYRFSHGEASDRHLTLVYQRDGATVGDLVYFVRERRPDDPPSGTRRVEGDRIDVWDERFHYVATGEGDRPQALVDSAR